MYKFIMIKQVHCVYLKHTKEGFPIMTFYVNDILIASNARKIIVETNKWLVSQFDMKDIGDVSHEVTFA